MEPNEPSGYRIDPGQGRPADPQGHGAPAHDEPAPYEPPAGYAPPPVYGQPGSYAPSPGYGAPPGYGPPPGYGAPPPYGPPQPGWYWPPAAPWNGPPPSTRWPHGPDRPGLATAAAVLGFVTAGLTLIAAIAFAVSVTRGTSDTVSAVLLLGIPCAVGQIVGGVHLLRRRGRNVLFLASLSAVVVLVLALVTGMATLPSSDEVLGLVVFLLLAVILPVVTTVFSVRPVVSAWIAAAQSPQQVSSPYLG